MFCEYNVLQFLKTGKILKIPGKLSLQNYPGKGKGKESFQSFRVMASCQKLGVILANNVIKKLMTSKISIRKKCAPKFEFFYTKKIRKIRMIFDVEHWLRKSNSGTV